MKVLHSLSFARNPSKRKPLAAELRLLRNAALVTRLYLRRGSSCGPMGGAGRPPSNP